MIDRETKEQVDVYLSERDADFLARQERKIAEEIEKREREREERSSRRLQRWTAIFGAGAFAIVSGFSIWLTNSVSNTAQATAATEARKVIADDDLRKTLADNVNNLQQDALEKISSAIESSARAEELAKRYEAEAKDFRGRAAIVLNELSSIESDLRKNKDIIDQLGDVLEAEAGLEQIVEAALESADLQERIAKASIFPRELVIASTVRCTDLRPGTWSEYSNARGRFVVAVNSEAFTDENGIEISAKAPNAIGGAEEGTLSERHLPGQFRYALDDVPWAAMDNTNWNNSYGSAPHLSKADYSDRKHGWTVGGNQPHPNMPPYIALYFCKKD